MRKGMFGRVGREKSEAENLVAKRASKHAVFNAKVVEEKQFGCTKNLMMRFSKLLSKWQEAIRMLQENVLDDNENICFDTMTKNNAQKEH